MEATIFYADAIEFPENVFSDYHFQYWMKELNELTPSGAHCETTELDMKLYV